MSFQIYTSNDIPNVDFPAMYTGWWNTKGTTITINGQPVNTKTKRSNAERRRSNREKKRVGIKSLVEFSY
jgi:hypothetical protein